MTDTPNTQSQDHPTFATLFLSGLKRNWQAYSLFVVLVIASAAFITGVIGFNKTQAQNERLTLLVECQNRYNEINNERTRQVAVTIDRERVAEQAADRALFALVTDLATGAEKPNIARDIEELRIKLNEQEKARLDGDLERTKHPVPLPPKALCGGLQN